VAAGVGVDRYEPMPRAIARTPRPEVRQSPALSLLARPGETGVRTRKVAILVADGVEGASLLAVREALRKAGAIVRRVGPRLGGFATLEGEVRQAEATRENEPGVLWDALVLPGGKSAVDALALDGRAAEFVKDQYRHCKPILVIGEGRALLEGA